MHCARLTENLCASARQIPISQSPHLPRPQHMQRLRTAMDQPLASRRMAMLQRHLVEGSALGPTGVTPASRVRNQPRAGAACSVPPLCHASRARVVRLIKEWLRCLQVSHMMNAQRLYRCTREFGRCHLAASCHRRRKQFPHPPTHCAAHTLELIQPYRWYFILCVEQSVARNAPRL